MENKKPQLSLKSEIPTWQSGQQGPQNSRGPVGSGVTVCQLVCDHLSIWKYIERIETDRKHGGRERGPARTRIKLRTLQLNMHVNHHISLF